MAENNTLDRIRDLLDRAQQNADLWDRAEVKPTQASHQMTQGLSGDSPGGQTSSPFSFNMDPMSIPRSQLFQAQQADSLQMQNMLQQRLSMSAFAQGTPGALSPSSTMGDPRVANYQLQAMYQMNPYMSNFFAQSQGAPSMNLAPTQFMTSSRLGVFRKSTAEQAPLSGGLDNILRDVLTLNRGDNLFVQGDNAFLPTRGFAAYEDSVDARIAASRRMSKRMESLAGTGVTLGTLGAGLFAGGIGGIAATTGVGLGAGVAVSAYMDRRAETDRIYGITKEFSTNYRSGGFRGEGFGMGEASNVMLGMRKAAAADPRYSMADYMDVLENAGSEDLMTFNASPSGTMDKVKSIIKELDIFMKLAGDPDVKSAMGRMGQLQSLGINPSQMQGAAATLKSYARLAGTSVDDIMGTSGAYGAQIAAQTGALPMYGMQVGALAAGSINTSIQMGQFSQGQAALLGGKGGMSQSLTQMITEQTQSYLGNVGLAALVDFEGGKAVFNKERFQNYMTTGNVPGGAQTLLEAGGKSLAKMGTTKQIEFLMNMRFLTGEAMGEIKTGEQQINLSRNINREMSGRHDMPMNEFLFSQFGDQGDLMKNFMSPENLRSVKSMMNQSNLTVTEARRQADKERNTFWARAGSGISTMFNNLMSMGPYGYFSQREQQNAAEATGQFFMRGVGEGGAMGDNAGRVLGNIAESGMNTFAEKYVGATARDRLESYIMGHEGTVTTPYADKGGGRVTVGMGNNLSAKWPMTATNRGALKWDELRDNEKELVAGIVRKDTHLKGYSADNPSISANDSKIIMRSAIDDHENAVKSVIGNKAFNALSGDAQSMITDFSYAAGAGRLNDDSRIVELLQAGGAVTRWPDARGPAAGQGVPADRRGH